MPARHSPSAPAPRRPRSDAQRNRARILEVAKEAFTQTGADASLDEIARQAGVGPGTLYRHFPTRDALIEAVYSVEVEKLAAAQHRFSETLPPLDALRAWMLLFVDHLAAKLIIAPALNSIAGGPTRLFEGSRGRIHGALEILVERARSSGDLRPDLQAGDLLRPMIGVAYTPFGPDWLPSARRLVDILIAGSRTAAASGPDAPHASPAT